MDAEQVQDSRQTADPNPVSNPIPGPNPTGFIAWGLRCHFFRRMLTGPKAFLEPPGMVDVNYGG